MKRSHLTNQIWWLSGFLVWGSGVLGGGEGAFGFAVPQRVAQIIPDTAGDRTTNTVINSLTPEKDLIQGGIRPQNGINLFHSFQEFNIEPGHSVHFENPNGVINIFSRITGSNPSDIRGTLGVEGAANLFLMNPNGIVFGSRSRLDVSGSFTATTANAIQFGDRGSFSATNPATPAPLLTINPSAYLFSQVPAGNITVSATEQILLNSVLPELSLLRLPFQGLRVGNRQNLTLLGGNVSVSGGTQYAGLHALGGRIEIGAVAGAGAIGLNANGSLSFPENLPRADVNFVDFALVNVALDTGGDLAVTARDIRVSDSSLLVSGILPLSGTQASQAGNLGLNATNQISIRELSGVGNIVFPLATGNGGDLEITAGLLEVTGGSQLSASTWGQGDAGNVIIQVRDHTLLQGTGLFETPSTISSFVLPGIVLPGIVLPGIQVPGIQVPGIQVPDIQSPGGIGNGGDIEITTGSLYVTGNAVLSTGTAGIGNAGSISIEARDRVYLNTGFVLNTVEQRTRGQGGNIGISARSLEIVHDSQVSTTVNGNGDAGNVTLRVGDRLLLDRGGIVFSAIGFSGTGNGGDISITGSSANLSVDIRNGSQVITSSLGHGDVGDVFITARDVNLDGTRARANSTARPDPAAIFSSVGVATGRRDIRVSTSNTALRLPRLVIISNPQGDRPIPGARGDSGTVTITSDTLSLNNGSLITSSTYGIGAAGTINITTNNATILNHSSSISSEIQTGANDLINNHNQDRGTDVNIHIRTGSLAIANGSQLITSTFGQGNAGDITINATQDVEFSGRTADGLPSGAFSAVSRTGNGNGGTITLTTNGSLLIGEGAQLVTSTDGQGNAGNITIETTEQIELSGRSQNGSASGIFSAVDQHGNGNAGNVTITTSDSLIASDGAQLSANAVGANDGGSLTINANQVTLQDEATGTVSSLGTGQAGTLTVNSSLLTLNEGELLARSAGGRGGNIEIRENHILRLRNGSLISAVSGAENNNVDGNNVDGNIRITTRFIFANASEDSDIVATGAGRSVGRGGDVSSVSGIIGSGSNILVIASGGVFGTQFRLQRTPTSDIVATGEVRLISPDSTSAINSLTDLDAIAIDTNELLANSCIMQRNPSSGIFYITGTGGLPNRPGYSTGASFPTGEVRNVPEETGEQRSREAGAHSWQMGDAIVEPQGVYQLPNGELVMSRECGQ